MVRKHQAPNGALRLTLAGLRHEHDRRSVRTHRAPNGALRHRHRRLCDTLTNMSESTERQKVN